GSGSTGPSRPWSSSSSCGRWAGADRGRTEKRSATAVVSSNAFKFVMLPPQSDTTRAWAKRLAESVPEARVVVAEDAATAAREIGAAEAAFGALGKEPLSKATKLRWLQAPFAAPPAGYYYPELISHPVGVTNFREIYNDHIGAHIMAFVLAFARGLHMYIPQQL